MHDAFLSYARDDLVLAEQLQKALADAGKDVWRDLSGIAGGEIFWSRIEDAIAASHYFLFIMSDRSLTSANCRKEVEYALQSQKKILPVDIRTARTSAVWESIAGLQWIYAADRFESAVSDLLQTLNDIPQHRRLHTRWLERAREWVDKQRESGILLRGSELASAEEWLEDSGGRTPAPSDLQIEFIRASRTGENSTRDRALARRLANQAEVLFSEGAGMLEKSLLVAVESVRRLPLMTAHRVLSQGLERLPTRLPLLPVPEIYAVGGDPTVLVAVAEDGRSLVITDLAGTIPERKIDSGLDKIASLEFCRSSNLVLAWTSSRDRIALVDLTLSAIAISLSSGGPFQVRLSHDYSQLLFLSDSGSLKILDLKSAEWSLEVRQKEQTAAAALAFHGRYVAIQPPGGNVTIWSLPDLRELSQIDPGELESLEFSHDGSRILTVPTRGGEPKLWGTSNGKCLSNFDVHNWGVQGVSFRPGSGHLITTSLDRTARIWDADGVNVALFEHESTVFKATWSNDGNFVATPQQNGAAQLWDTLGRSFGSTLPDDTYRRVLAVSISPRSKLLVTAVDTSIERWGFGLDLGPLALLDGKNPLLTNVAFSVDGRYMAAVYEYHRLVVHDLQSGQEVGRFQSPEDQSVYYVSASPDPRYFLLHAPTTFLVELPAFRVTRLHVEGIWEEMAWSRTGRIIAGDGDNRFGIVWSIPEDRELFAGDQSAWGVALSPDEQLVAMVGQHSSLRLTRLADQSTQVLAGHEGNTHSCAFNADGKWIVSSGADGTARIWEVATAKQLMVFSHSQYGVRHAIFSPDGKNLATSGGDGSVRLWDLASGREIFRGLHSSSANLLRFDPSGKYLASAGNDQTARVWDLESGEEVARFRHEEPVLSAGFSPDGNFLSTLSAYGSRRVGRLWLWNPAELLRQVETRLSRSMTAEEKLYYLGVSDVTSSRAASAAS